MDVSECGDSEFFKCNKALKTITVKKCEEGEPHPAYISEFLRQSILRHEDDY